MGPGFGMSSRLPGEAGAAGPWGPLGAAGGGGYSRVAVMESGGWRGPGRVCGSVFGRGLLITRPFDILI